jgi:DHA1 family tetracycline resistance protein-like MFS transporter
MSFAFEKKDKFFTGPLKIVFLTVLIDLVGFGIVIPLLPFYAEHFNATPFEVGMLVAVYSLAQFIFSPILGRLSDRYGRRPILFLSILGSGVGYLVLGLAGALWLVFIGRILGGVTAGNLSTAQAYIADVTSRENRAKGMGLFGMAFGIGFITGPALAGFLGAYGETVPFFIASGLSFFNAAMLYFFLPESLKTKEKSMSRRGRFADLKVAMTDKRFGLISLQYFLLIASFSMMTTAFAYFTSLNYSYTVVETGYLLAYVGFIAAPAQGLLFPRLAKFYGEGKLVVVGCVLLVLSLAAVPYVRDESVGVFGLLLGTGMFALGNSLASPSLTSLASKSASEKNQGATMGLMQSVASLARAVGPALTAVLLNTSANRVDQFSLKRTFWTAAAIMLITLLSSVYFLFTERSDLKADLTTDFQ